MDDVHFYRRLIFLGLIFSALGQLQISFAQDTKTETSNPKSKTKHKKSQQHSSKPTDSTSSSTPGPKTDSKKISKSIPKEDPPLVDITEKKPKRSFELLGNVGFTPTQKTAEGGDTFPSPPIPAPVLGATAGYGSLDNQMMEIPLTYSSGNVGSIALTVTTVGGRLKVAMGKYFYAAGGGDLRMATGKYNVLTANSASESLAGATSNAIALTAACGFQKIFGSIIVGADMLGLSYPLYKFGVTETLPADGNYDAADAANQKVLFDKAGGGLTVTILKVGVGTTF